MTNRAWVTLATNDSYALGALVLANSLRRVNSVYPTVVLITPAVTDNMRGRLGGVFAEVVTVDVLDSRDAAHLALLARPELGVTFTKIHCWSLTQYDKCVFLDADTLVVQNSDELFEREELSAAPDVGWPDCFNSGVFVYRPSEGTFNSLLEFAKERGSFDGGDQGLLNSYFSGWARGDINKHLPFLYNVTSVAFYSYLPALKEFGKGLKIIHFIGNAKPWLQSFNWETRTVTAEGHVQPTLQLWWDIFVDSVHPQLDQTMTGLAGTLSRLTLGASSSQQTALDEHTRRQGWEAGNIDYLGADSFDNIWAKISSTLAQSPVPAKPECEAKPTEGEVATITVASETSVKSEPIIAPSTEQKLEPSPTTPLQVAPSILPEATPTSDSKPVTETTAPAFVDVSDVEAKPAPTAVESIPALEKEFVPTTEHITESTTESPTSATKPIPATPLTSDPIPQAVEAISEEPKPTKTPVVEPAQTLQVQEPTLDVAVSIDTVQTTPISEVPISVPKTEEVTSQSTLPAPTSEKVPSEPANPENEGKVLVPEPIVKTSDPDSPTVAVTPPQSPPTLELTQSTPKTPIEATPEKSVTEQASIDSPPLISTPVKDSVSPKSAEEIKSRSVADGAEPRKETRKAPFIDKLNCQLKPLPVDTTLLTPDSEQEDAATLAQKIIASELGIPHTPQIICATPPVITAAPSLSRNKKQLSVEEPDVPTPPVSLAQIGIIPKSDSQTGTGASTELPESKVVVTNVVKPSEANEASHPNIVPTSEKETSRVKEIVKEKVQESSKVKENIKKEEIILPEKKINKASKPEMDTKKIEDAKKKDKVIAEENISAATPVLKSTNTTNKPKNENEKVSEQKNTVPVASISSEKAEISDADVRSASEKSKPEECALEKKIPCEIKPEAPEPRKKKIVKKVPKKEESSDKGSSSEPTSSTPAPVPPPRKKEKKPAEKK